MSKLKCSIVEDLMPLYIEDLLNEETKNDIELHLEECEDCKEVYDELKKGVNLEYEKNMDLKDDEYEELKTDTLNSIKNYLNKIDKVNSNKLKEHGVKGFSFQIQLSQETIDYLDSI